jgi:hypothetical protein
LLPRVENVRRRIAQLIGEVQQSGEMDIHDL